jgi:hypothetical protein
MSLDQVQADWDHVHAGKELTNEGFEEAITEFISVYFDEEALTEQKTYLAQAKKLFTMTVETFHSRLKWIVLLMGYFPGAPDMAQGQIYSDSELKYIFKQAMPWQWQQTFAQLGLNLTTLSWPQLEHYFRQRKTESNKNSHNDNNGIGNR